MWFSDLVAERKEQLTHCKTASTSHHNCCTDGPDGLLAIADITCLKDALVEEVAGKQSQPAGEARRCGRLQSADTLVKFLGLKEQELADTPPAVVPVFAAADDEAEPPSPAPAPPVAEARDGVDSSLHAAAATSFVREQPK